MSAERQWSPIRWIDNARIVAASMVVVGHVSAAVVVEANRFGTAHWWVGNLYDSFQRWSVPVFIMISGMLLLDSSKDESLLDFYKKRASRILLPLIFWSLFFSAWIVVTGNAGPNPSVSLLVKNILSGTPYPHLWYLYMVPSLYLFTPFLRKIVKHSSYNELVFLCVVLFGISMITIAVKGFSYSGISLFINWFLIYLPYFFVGYVIGVTPKSPRNWILASCFLVSGLLTSIGCYYVGQRGSLDGEIYFYEFLSVTVVPMAISGILLLRKLSVPFVSTATSHKLALLSFGVYLVHPAIIDVLRSLGFSTTSHATVAVPAISVLVIGLSFVAALVISRIPYLRKVIG